jgi:hypothetical protein
VNDDVSDSGTEALNTSSGYFMRIPCQGITRRVGRVFAWRRRGLNADCRTVCIGSPLRFRATAMHVLWWRRHGAEAAALPLRVSPPRQSRLLSAASKMITTQFGE